MSQEKQVILVTGASSGIGAAIAERLARDGHQVYGTGRSASGRTAGGVELLALDVRSSESVSTCVQTVQGRAGRLDVLVNNAGYLVAGAIEEVTLEQAKEQFETNFFGVVRTVQAVLPTMRRQKAGKIVNISSLAGLVPLPFWGFYNASKFAVEGFSETLRAELKPFGIRVALVEPGSIKTPFYAQPMAAGMAEYSPWRERFAKSMRGFEAKAPGPEVVAAVVSRVVARARPSLRNRVTREATIFPLLRWLLPASAFESGLRAGFHLDEAGYERPH